MLSITQAFVDRYTSAPTGYTAEDVADLNTALTAHEADNLDTYLNSLPLRDRWDIHHLTSDIDATFGASGHAGDLNLMHAISEISTSAKIAATSIVPLR